jgi:phosphate starvation-inducible PhoH-like protein
MNKRYTPAAKILTRREAIVAGNRLAREAAEFSDPRGVDSAPRNFHIQPKTGKQQQQLDAIEHNAITAVIGPAGTGKTYISCMKVVQLINRGEFSGVVLCRANVPTGNSLGHFPGTIEEKLTPWLAPMLQVLKAGLGGARYEIMLRRGEIELQPLETIRGQSFSNKLILVDEAQNLDMEEIKAVTTRLGEGSKMVLMGDPNQSDVERGFALTRFADLCNSHGIEIPVVRYSVDDIVRSDVVGQLVRMFNSADLYTREQKGK